jgi:hypothetical protein
VPKSTGIGIIGDNDLIQSCVIKVKLKQFDKGSESDEEKFDVEYIEYSFYDKMYVFCF